jgi:hypothetical protein
MTATTERVVTASERVEATTGARRGDDGHVA